MIILFIPTLMLYGILFVALGIILILVNQWMRFTHSNTSTQGKP